MIRLSLLFALLLASPAVAESLGNLAQYPPTKINLTITTTSALRQNSNLLKFSF